MMQDILPSFRSNGAKYWKSVRISKILLKKSIISEIDSSNDPRPHWTVSIGNHAVVGLLDSGASISCLGRNASAIISKTKLRLKPIESTIKTADGANQKVIGYVDAEIKYGGKLKLIRLYVVPSLSQSLYLGIDFWNAFDVAPKMLDAITVPLPDPNIHSLNVSQARNLNTIRELFPSCEAEGLGRTSLISHHIDVGSTSPIKQRHYPVSPAVQRIMYDELDRMLALGVIEESQSAWNSPVVLVRKSNGKARLCLDSRALNKVTTKDAYPMPNIDGILGRLGDTHFISSIDLKDAFWQIELDEESRARTAFTVPGRPLYQFCRMPFGLCNSPQTMCRLMDRVIPGDLRDFVFVFIDDLLVVSANFETHLQRLKRVAECLRKANLTINVEKSKFVMKELRYLGYIIGNGCLKTDPEKVHAIQSFPVPKTVRQVRSFLGLTGWYRRFIANYAGVASPITNLLAGKNSFKWSPEAQAAFERLKKCITTAPILAHPDFTKPFIIQCDASGTGVGSVLYQVLDDGLEHPIAYTSKKLNAAQRNYSVTELECYAAVHSVKKFRAYVEMLPFTIVTDHASLKWLMAQRDLSGRLARWSLKLQAFDFKIEHRKGSLNVVPDALSRMYAEELSIDADCLKVDLNSEHFNTDAYMEMREHILANAQQLPDLKVREARVYKRTEVRSTDLAEENSCWRLWIPEPMQAELIRTAHDPPLSGHQGVAKTTELLKRHLYWPGMARQVQVYVSRCATCKEIKAPNQILRPPMGQQIVVERPWQRIYIDLMGPYPRSKAGNTHIIIVLDQFSKFPLLHPVGKATSQNIIKFLKTQVFHVFGTPESVLSDNGKQFISKDFEAFLSRHGVKHISTGIYSPQVNASERVNRSLLASIRAYIGPVHTNWDVNLSAIGNALRNTTHKSTRYSPHYLVFGRHMIQHGSSYQQLRELKGLQEYDINVLPPADHQSLVHSTVADNLEHAHADHARTYNTRSREVKFKPGQEVYRRNFVQSSFKKQINAKLAKKFLKCRIRRKVGTALYELENMQGQKIPLLYHAQHLRQ